MFKSEPDMDLVWGCAAIADEIKRTQRQTYYLLENGVLPARKVGNTWVAVRPKLHEFFKETA